VKTPSPTCTPDALSSPIHIVVSVRQHSARSASVDQCTLLLCYCPLEAMRGDCLRVLYHGRFIQWHRWVQYLSLSSSHLLTSLPPSVNSLPYHTSPRLHNSFLRFDGGEDFFLCQANATSSIPGSDGRDHAPIRRPNFVAFARPRADPNIALPSLETREIERNSIAFTGSCRRVLGVLVGFLSLRSPVIQCFKSHLTHPTSSDNSFDTMVMRVLETGT
jgi:hypothetical protein